MAEPSNTEIPSDIKAIDAPLFYATGMNVSIPGTDPMIIFQRTRPAVFAGMPPDQIGVLGEPADVVQLSVQTLNVTYDACVDVLYITKVRDTAIRGVEDEHGIVWRYDKLGNALSATILDFRETWERKQNDLAQELSRGFHISTPQAETVVSYALGGRRC